MINDTTLASDNPFCFRCNLLEIIQKLIFTIDRKIKNEKLQYGIHRKAAKISAVSSGRTDHYKYLKEEEVFPPYQSRMIEQATLTNSPLGKAFKN